MRTKKIDTEWTCQQCKYTQEGMDMKGCEHCADPHKYWYCTDRACLAALNAHENNLDLHNK